MEFELNLDAVRTELEKKNAPYRVERIIGCGTFGTVVKACMTNTNETVAVKFVHASKMHEYLASEVRNHRILRHPHVIHLHRVMEVGGHLAIVMEYANGSNLYNAMRRDRVFSEPLARWIFQQLILAVDYCHRKGVASRDIKCENVLLIREQKLPIVKLSDFGYSYSTMREGKNAKSVVGSVNYMAPEILTNVDQTRYDAMKADIWSCGVVLYVMITGHYPFRPKRGRKRGRQPEREVIRQKVAKLDYKLPEKASGELCSLLKRILEYADKRATLKEIMNHPWFLKDFPEEAQSMNAELIAQENDYRWRPTQMQTDEEVELEIMRTSMLDRMKRPPEVVPDSLIDEEIEEELRRNPSNALHVAINC